MIGAARRLLMQFAEKVLDVDDTEQPRGHIRLLEDYAHRFEFDTDKDDVREFLAVLKKKHLVDDIVVSSLNGSAIASTNGDSVSQAVSGAALFNYVKSEIPRSDAILVKSASGAGWHMFFPSNRKLYIVKAASDLSPVEMRALAREIENFFLHKGTG
ncbi:MAG: hypothetical protein HY544_04330 [Candidatus Diapherotrites archaeon]|uniref:Roadblock/LC7 domain-containing protein n=1 Tax=Candidatus Iainarchaeum sp. TaxID=3101447 RepID=A0A8T3YKD7_9ARCH|nr:hypothetical protein [Candidatus Diapherotrites archaeon]